jgi:hypothetical protein
LIFRVFLGGLLFGSPESNIQRIFKIYRGEMPLFEKVHFAILNKVVTDFTFRGWIVDVLRLL